MYCVSMSLLHEVLSVRKSLLQRGCPAAIVPVRKPASAWAPFHGLQLLPGAWALTGWMWISVLTWLSPWAVGAQLPHRGLPPRLQGNLCSGGWSTSSPSFTVGGLQGCFSHLFSLPSHSCCTFFSLLKYVGREVPPALLMGSGLASSGSVLEPSGTGSVRHGGSFWNLLHPWSTATSQTLLRKPIQGDAFKVVCFWRECLPLLENDNLSLVAFLTSLRAGSCLRWVAQEMWRELREEEHVPFRSAKEARLHLQCGRKYNDI